MQATPTFVTELRAYNTVPEQHPILRPCPITIHLPIEVLGKILAFLHVDCLSRRWGMQDFMPCLLVNRRWHETAARLYWHTCMVYALRRPRIRRLTRRIQDNAPWTVRPEYIHHLRVFIPCVWHTGDMQLMDTLFRL